MGECSDVLTEAAMTRAQVEVGQQHNGENKAVSRFSLHPTLCNPIPRTETPLKLKLAWKVSNRSKRDDLRGIWDTLAPGKRVVRTSPTTTLIKGLSVREVKVRNSDISKFGSKAERETDNWLYAQRRLLPYNKT